jgi:PAS domain S-box-containing protein
LYESEKKLHLLIDGVTDHAIYPLDASGNITMWNKGAERLHGYLSDEVIGKHYSMLFTGADKKDDKAQLWMEAAVKNNSIQVEGESIRKDGSLINVNTVFTALRNDDGSLYGFSIITHDITSRKQTEDKIRRMNAVLEERVKERTAELDSINKELESFAYSISHDLKAPLRAISSFAQILQEDHTGNLNSEGQNLIATIIVSVRRMDELIRDILSLSRVGRKEITYKLIEMNELVQVVYHELTDEVQQGKIHLLVQDLPGAYCDSVLIKQVWINLISNAIKYSSKKESPVIEIFGKEEGNMIVYTIRDNGAGFNPKYKDKLFTLFQRLHNSREFEGSGAGLAIVKRIVQRFGGDVYAVGNPGKGASFTFSLPAQRK